MAYPKPSQLPETLTGFIREIPLEQLEVKNEPLKAILPPVVCYSCDADAELFIAFIQEIKTGDSYNYGNFYYSARVTVQMKASFDAKLQIIPSCKFHAEGYDLVLCQYTMLGKLDVKFDPTVMSQINEGTFRSIRLDDEKTK